MSTILLFQGIIPKHSIASSILLNTASASMLLEKTTIILDFHPTPHVTHLYGFPPSSGLAELINIFKLSGSLNFEDLQKQISPLPGGNGFLLPGMYNWNTHPDLAGELGVRFAEKLIEVCKNNFDLILIEVGNQDQDNYPYYLMIDAPSVIFDKHANKTIRVFELSDQLLDWISQEQFRSISDDIFIQINPFKAGLVFRSNIWEEKVNNQSTIINKKWDLLPPPGTFVDKWIDEYNEYVSNPSWKSRREFMLVNFFINLVLSSEEGSGNL